MRGERSLLQDDEPAGSPVQNLAQSGRAGPKQQVHEASNHSLPGAEQGSVKLRHQSCDHTEPILGSQVTQVADSDPVLSELSDHLFCNDKGR